MEPVFKNLPQPLVSLFESWPDPPQGRQQQAAIRAVSSDYFAALKIPLWKGRFFSKADARIALPLMGYFDRQPET